MESALKITRYIGAVCEKLKALGYRFWRISESGQVDEVDDLQPQNFTNNYNGVDDDCRNRFASVRGLPPEIAGSA